MARAKKSLTEAEEEAAEESLEEEQEAAATYTKRGKKAKNPKLRRSLSHARRDEKEHAGLFRQTLRQRKETIKRV